MNDLMTKLDIILHDRVDRFQQTLEKVKTKAKDEVRDWEIDDDFFERMEEIEEALEEGRDRLADASKTVENLGLEALNKIKAWRTEREIKKLEKEAEKSRRYAKAAIDVAIGALNEAEYAITRAYVTKEFSENASADV